MIYREPGGPGLEQRHTQAYCSTCNSGWRWVPNGHDWTKASLCACPPVSPEPWWRSVPWEPFAVLGWVAYALALSAVLWWTR